MVVTLPVSFRTTFNRQGPLAKKLAAAAYAVYIFHQPVIILLALVLRGIRLDLALKWVLVAPAAVSLWFLVVDTSSGDCHLPGVFCNVRGRDTSLLLWMRRSYLGRIGGREMTVTYPAQTHTPAERSSGKSVRLYYLDWLQVLAILGVFLFHATHPFDELGDWIIKNPETTFVLNFFGGFLYPWGMPFFLLMAGAASWFSLRRRTLGRYARERVTRLLIPFIIGSIVLTPIQAYYELIHKGWWGGGSIVEFILSAEARTYYYTEYHPIILGPQIFNRVGYHLWFVAFLFAFSLIALPVFTWLKNDSGKRFVASFARLATWRGGLLVFVIPLALVRFTLQRGVPSDDYGWADFVYYLLFFVSGYILIADEVFMRAIRRDWRLHLTLGVLCTLFIFSLAAGVPVYDWMGSPGTPGFYLTWTVWGINSWCWTMVMFYVGMRFLDTTNKWLQYSREATYPFFFVHQPVIIFFAFYAAGWQVHLLIKLLVVVIGSFAVSLGTYQLLVRRINPVRALFGMKPLKKKRAEAPTARPA
jgi:peptidoglycan/LPS O-acetylase OafA/YrhL